MVGCVVHDLPAPHSCATTPATALKVALTRHGLRLIAGVPHRPELTWLRVGDLVRELNPEILNEGDLSRRIKDVAVFAQGIPNGVRVLDDGRLIVVPGDRHEVVMAACLAAQNGTRLAALLLSAGIRPDPQIWQLTRAAFTGLPVLLVEPDSYQTATRVRDLDPRLPPDDVDRVEGVTNNVADALNASWLQSLAGSARPHRLTPAAFRHQVVEQARAAHALIVLPEGTEPRTMRAAVLTIVGTLPSASRAAAKRPASSANTEPGRTSSAMALGAQRFGRANYQAAVLGIDASCLGHDARRGEQRKCCAGSQGHIISHPPATGISVPVR